MDSEDKGLNQSLLQRLEYIDFCLFFLGRMSRNALIDYFGISSAAATRDLSAYKELHPHNIDYDKSRRVYYASKKFEPAYKHDAIDALLLFSKETRLDDLGKIKLICERPTEINAPAIKVLAEISRAIYQEKPVKISYYSLSSGLTEREFIPFAFVDTGLRWHVRGYDRNRNRFTDFVVNRIENVSILEGGLIKPTERREADNQWNRIVEMRIIPHPKLVHAETISHEYDMKEGLLRIDLRAAIVGYFLRRWNIDCSKNYCGNPEEYHLWLENNAALYGVENLKLAPLYSE